MKQTGLLLVVTGLILLQLSIQLPQQNAAWGMTLGASILLKFFVNRTDHALSAHPDRPQMNKKSRGTFCHPAAFILHKSTLSAGRTGCLLRHMLVPINLFVFHTVRFLHDIERTIFCFVINSSDIFADHSEH